MPSIGTKTTKPIRAFSLIELLVTSAIIALLSAILLPSLSHARKNTQAAVCLSNLRQMAFAAHTYTQMNKGFYPFSNWIQPDPDNPNHRTEYCWDFQTESLNAEIVSIKPGLLWHKTTAMEIQQCPSFKGQSNTKADPYTGYNYNSSYIGGIGAERPTGSRIFQSCAKNTEVRRPYECALFGDGQWSEGANKYMRSPFTGNDASFSSGRIAGTQGYRHLKRTNVAFCDGHAGSWIKRYTLEDTYGDKVAPATGFLSANNSLYDLE